MHARKTALVLGLAGLALAGQAGLAMQSPGAMATLMDASGAKKGTARFTETPTGLSVTVEAIGIPAGTKGLHLHTVGKCEGPKFTSAGSHWNPTEHKHGMENPAGPHMGDMRNIAIAANGSETATAMIPNARLRGGSNALLDADGASIMIHAGPDDYKTDPAGASGDRIACGVLKPA